MAESSPAIENLFSEARTFPPPDEFKADALVKDMSLHERAEQDLEGFWTEQAERLRWTKPWDRVLEWDLPFAKWFVGGQLNVSDNCLDRHVDNGDGDKVAYHWEGEPGDTRTITYEELRDDVARFANALKSIGVQRGDRINIYMGMVPELPVAMLACARLGAAHSVVFGGFSADALRDRINDAEAKVLITQDEGWRAGKVVPLKQNADDAVADTPSIEKVVVLRRTGNDVPWDGDRDVWWHELVEGQSADCPPEAMDAEDLLYLLYTSGTTAKPKGIMHTTGGYLTGVSTTHRLVFDLH
ncbi:MAG TPA: AMP-binding protein, partial [Actinomycetota bacterium]|nr:AMP-binding protein [Actinomycetota bacterium]